MDTPLGAYPRYYRMSHRWMMLTVGCGALMLFVGAAIGLASIWQVTTHYNATNYFKYMIEVFAVLFFTVLGAYSVAEGLRSCITLGNDFIKVGGCLRSHEMRRADIIGMRVRKPQHKILLYAGENYRQKMSVPLTINFDEYFKYWFQDIPDLDIQEKQKDYQTIISDPKFGKNEGERGDTLLKSIKYSRATAFLGIGSAIWGLLFPQPYWLCVTVLIATPPAMVLLVLLWPRYYRLEVGKSKVLASVFPTFLLPSFILLIRVIFDFNIVDQELACELAVLVIGIICFSAYVVDGEIRKTGLAFGLVILLMSGYGYGSVIELNSLLDSGPRIITRVGIVSKDYTSGKGAHAEVTLRPWGPVVGQNSVPVPNSVYRAVAPGDVVCTYLHPGALGIRWFRVYFCPSSNIDG